MLEVEMRVMFIGTLYQPSKEKRKELEIMQETIYWSRIQYLHEIRHNSPKMIEARIENLHKMYRDKWEVIVGGKGVCLEVES
jgi:hypothetical protein